MGRDENGHPQPLHRSRSFSTRGDKDHGERKVFFPVVRHLIVCLALHKHFKFMTSRRRTQYMTKLKEWGYEKNIRASDMRALVNKDLKRKAEDPLRPSAFRLRGKSVPKHKIERYEKDKGLFHDDFDPLVATPSVISCDTPRSIPRSPTVQPEASAEVLDTSMQLTGING